jgi:flagellar basal body-associated protein FliL
MEGNRHISENFSQITYTVLLFITGALILLLVIGTVIGLVRFRSSEPLITFGNANRIEQMPAQTEDIRIYSGLGRLRIPLVNNSIMILSLSFPYSAGDIHFTEELASKTAELRTLATAYFSSLPEEALIHINEEIAKQEILRSFNNNLRLGRIETLFFNDMLVIDSENAQP